MKGQWRSDGWQDRLDCSGRLVKSQRGIGVFTDPLPQQIPEGDFLSPAKCNTSMPMDERLATFRPAFDEPRQQQDVRIEGFGISQKSAGHQAELVRCFLDQALHHFRQGGSVEASGA